METLLSSKTKTVVISPDRPFVVIGERINPTGRKKLAEELAAGDFSRVRSDALAQMEAGAHVLDVNSGVPGADEPAIMRQAVQMVMETVDAPLCFDSPNPAALEAALAIYSGKALINSTTGEDAALERVLPLAKKYGAAFIGLCNDDRGIPAADIVIDPLVLTVGADSNAGKVTLETIRLIRQELGVNVSAGASNVSFGLPDRPSLNAAFMAMAMTMGMDAAITNPLEPTVHTAILAADLFLGHDAYGGRWIKDFRKREKAKADK
jgi:5-methyltetrahydrofolate--homocysteine methyltransferase